MIRHTCDMCNADITYETWKVITVRMMKPFIDKELEFCEDCFEKLINQTIPILGTAIRQKINEDEERRRAKEAKEAEV